MAQEKRSITRKLAHAGGWQIAKRAAKMLPFGGTAVLIMVGVGRETVKQIESQLMMRNYEGFLR